MVLTHVCVLGGRAISDSENEIAERRQLYIVPFQNGKSLARCDPAYILIA